jgi:hypothetical protein
MNKKIIGLVVVLTLVLITGGVLANGLLTRDLVGTMRYVDLEGGYWAVVSDGEEYIPLNLTDDYMAEGLKVTFEVVERQDVMGIHMGGTYVEIINIK